MRKPNKLYNEVICIHKFSGSGVSYGQFCALPDQSMEFCTGIELSILEHFRRSATTLVVIFHSSKQLLFCSMFEDIYFLHIDCTAKLRGKKRDIEGINCHTVHNSGKELCMRACVSALAFLYYEEVSCSQHLTSP